MTSPRGAKSLLVRSKGLEPSRLAALPPQGNLRLCASVHRLYFFAVFVHPWRLGASIPAISVQPGQTRSRRTADLPCAKSRALPGLIHGAELPTPLADRARVAGQRPHHDRRQIALSQEIHQPDGIGDLVARQHPARAVATAADVVEPLLLGGQSFPAHDDRAALPSGATALSRKPCRQFLLLLAVAGECEVCAMPSPWRLPYMALAMRADAAHHICVPAQTIGTP